MNKSNPYASKNNAVQVGIDRIGPDKSFMPNFNFAINGTDLELNLTAEQGRTNMRHAKYVVQDGKGNEVVGAHDVNALAATVTIDCSSLEFRSCWRIVFSSALTDGTRINRHRDLEEGSVLALQASGEVQDAWTA